MRQRYRRAISVLVITVVVVSGAFLLMGGSSASSGIDYPIDSSRLMQITNAAKKGGYQSYIQQYKSMTLPDKEVIIQADSYDHAAGMPEPRLERPKGSVDHAIITGAEGSISWSFQVPESGLYHIEMNVMPMKGKDSDIERELQIDGMVPFAEARSIMFQRIWMNEQVQVERDANGNDLTPRQIEHQVWQKVLLEDATGYEPKPFLFYFSEGTHTLSLTSVREPMAIAGIKLYNPQAAPTYEELANLYKEEGMKPTSGVFIKVQGEDARYKSSPTLLPANHRASPAVEPYHVSKLRNNIMGAYAWRIPGQWLEWEVDVPESGLYTLSFKHLQNYLPGMSSLRTLTIDGELPYQEADRIGFPYSTEWQMKTVGGSDGEPYLLPLSQGKHTIRLEVTLGELAPIIRAVESSILELNGMYRKIISFTGTVPDTFRDYQLETRIPEMAETFAEQYKLLTEIAQMIEGPSGSKDRTAILNTLAYQLKDMAERPETVPSRVESFKSNVGALGAWLPSMNEQPLVIDYLVLASPDVTLPEAEASRLEQGWAGAQSFGASFIENYDQFGTTGEAQQKVIDVWLTSARDQALILKRLIDDRFTSETGIQVRLKLVPSNVLLPSTFSGKGPDVAIQVGNDLPVNYASRNAMLDLSQFPDFEEVTKRFLPSAIVPFEFNGKVYALPETQTFPVMFYRKDILIDELKLGVPETWDELKALIPKLQRQHLQISLPERTLNALGNESANTDIVSIAPNPAYTMLLYQNGGSYYQDEGLMSGLESEIAIQMFKSWTDMYINYKLPIRADFGNRFRTGEMPIGIEDYTLFNKLNVFAPELKGLWDFAPVPGVRQPDGTIRRETGSGGTAAMIFNSTSDQASAWEFIKWWTSKDAQLQFGREMEIRMGAAARYPTANQEAFAELPWQSSELKKLQSQMQWVKGVPEVPGGYFTGRHLDNAFRRVVVQGEDARESLDYYVRYINEEITLKRKEFNLPYKE